MVECLTWDWDVPSLSLVIGILLCPLAVVECLTWDWDVPSLSLVIGILLCPLAVVECLTWDWDVPSLSLIIGIVLYSLAKHFILTAKAKKIITWFTNPPTVIFREVEKKNLKLFFDFVRRL